MTRRRLHDPFTTALEDLAPGAVTPDQAARVRALIPDTDTDVLEALGFAPYQGGTRLNRGQNRYQPIQREPIWPC